MWANVISNLLLLLTEAFSYLHNLKDALAPYDCPIVPLRHKCKTALGSFIAVEDVSVVFVIVRGASLWSKTSAGIWLIVNFDWTLEVVPMPTLPLL